MEADLLADVTTDQIGAPFIPARRASFDVALACILVRNADSQTSLSLRESRELSSGEGELLIRFLLAHTAICDSPSPSLRLRPSRREGEATMGATSKRASEWILQHSTVDPLACASSLYVGAAFRKLLDLSI